MSHVLVNMADILFVLVFVAVVIYFLRPLNDPPFPRGFDQPPDYNMWNEPD